MASDPPASGHTQARDWLARELRRHGLTREAATAIMAAADVYAARAAAHAASAKPSAVIQLSDTDLSEADLAELQEKLQAAMQNEPLRLLVDSSTAADLARRDERERCAQLAELWAADHGNTLPGNVLTRFAALLRQDQP